MTGTARAPRPIPSTPSGTCAPAVAGPVTRRPRRRRCLLATGLLAVLTLGACGAGSDSSAASLAAPDAGRAAIAPNASGPAAVASGAAKDGAGAVAGAVPANLDRRVVRTADLTLRTKDVLGAAARVRAAVEAAQGYVADEKTVTAPSDPNQPVPGDPVVPDGGTGSPGSPSTPAGTTTSILTLRVPTERLDDLLAQVAAVGTVLARTQSSQDVTSTFVDTQSRLATQQSSVARVRLLLSKATSIGDVVQIEGELAKREADLESLQAQLASLRSQTSLSTLTVTLSPNPPVAPKAEPGRAGFVGGLVGGWHALVATLTVVATGLGALLPFAVVLAGLGLPVVLVLRRRRRGAPAV